MTTRIKPCRIAYRLSNHGPRRDSREYADLVLEVMLGSTKDAAREYDAHPEPWELERLQKIRAQGESTKYFQDSDSCSDSRFTLTWLTAESSYREYQTEWFACRVDACSFEPDVVKLLAKLIKLTGERGNDTGPANVLATLHEMGARRVKYADDVYSAWIFQDEPTVADIAIPWTPDIDPDNITPVTETVERELVTA